MSDQYTFGDHLPIEPIDAGATVFVAGPPMSPSDELVRAIVGDGSRVGDGMLFVTTNMTSERLLSTCRRSYPDFDFETAGVIDCSGQDRQTSEYPSQVKYISTQSDLTGIGMKFSALYESLYMQSTGHVRTGLVTLSSLAMYVDLRPLYQFVQTLSGRIDSADGLGVFAIDPSTHETKTVNTLSQVADGRIDVREPESAEADGELRVRGLAGQPDGWQPFTLPNAGTD